ncbi:hypothetical protein KV205_09985 [Streptomyces sp. SKN60]|uniref:hypothetical protein n=1 Tax=Streptomyces sp. SKN60 TaxID=2855506 RepID=UPI0022480C17|nr:hypothetical protein [Streptomyces sp. SKN60]MCX2180856.1 hypothetical protein [Streptomyces sp. SKN60]
MGIENDRLVFDYLSRIGDLAQQRQLPAAERRELVSGLRDEIERRRAVRGEGVRGILGDLGTPDEVVGRVAPVPSAPPVEAPDAEVPSPRAADWWDGAAADAADPTGKVAGFMGGVEIPELLKPPPEEDEDDEESGEAPEEPEEAEEAPEAKRKFRLPRFGSPLLLASALLLLAGAALGSVPPVAAGWLLAYLSRERRIAALTLPGLVAAGGAIWLWGRVEGRWGAPIAPGEAAMGAALSTTWPWTLRTAAILSALYLLWRARRA